MRVVLLCPLATRSGMLQRLCDLGRFDRGRCTRGVSSLDSHDGRRDWQRRSRIQHNGYATRSFFTGGSAGSDCVPRTNLSEAQPSCFVETLLVLG